jgi:very-short-patch-repair endonuclease
MKWLEIKEIANRLRNNPTESESLLWEEIRNRKLKNRKFLRQHPLIYDTDRDKNDFYFFIPDFYCASEKLVIELDGPIHEFQKGKDYSRDLILTSQDIRTLRIQNIELMNMEAVIIKIIQMFKS